MRAFLLVVLAVAGAVGIPFLPALADDLATARKALTENGIRVTGTGFNLTKESQLSKAMSTLNSLKRKYVAASQELARAESATTEADLRVQELLGQNVAIRKQMSQVRTQNFFINSGASQALSTNQSELAFAYESRKQLNKGIEELRKAASSAREKYIQQILDARQLSSEIKERYSALSKDKALSALLDQWNQASDKSLELHPSRMFESNLHRLEGLEKSIVTEKIALRREGNGFFTSVVINGKHTCEMQVDTGAGTLLLPHQMAVECGIDLTKFEPIMGGVANGAQIKAKLVILDSVRVGKFTAEHVQCAVFPPEATHTMPLLGMTFLGRFKAELNADASQLSLVKLDTDASISLKKKKTPSRKTTQQAPAGE